MRSPSAMAIIPAGAAETTRASPSIAGVPSRGRRRQASTGRARDGDRGRRHLGTPSLMSEIHQGDAAETSGVGRRRTVMLRSCLTRPRSPCPNLGGSVRPGPEGPYQQASGPECGGEIRSREYSLARPGQSRRCRAKRTPSRERSMSSGDASGRPASPRVGPGLLKKNPAERGNVRAPAGPCPVLARHRSLLRPPGTGTKTSDSWQPRHRARYRHRPEPRQGRATSLAIAAGSSPGVVRQLPRSPAAARQDAHDARPQALPARPAISSTRDEQQNAGAHPMRP